MVLFQPSPKQSKLHWHQKSVADAQCLWINRDRSNGVGPNAPTFGSLLTCIVMLGFHAERESGANICARTMRHANLAARMNRSEEHTSELQSLMRISYAVFCMKKKI